MKRVSEPEIMNGREQAKAYAMADFKAPNQMFVDFFVRNFSGLQVTGSVLDLGCGPADIPIRFALQYPQCRVCGVDGAEAMLKYGRQSINDRGLGDRITLIKGILPNITLPLDNYDALLSNSLLHHLDDPQVMWRTIKECGKKNAAVLVMDLFRPAGREEAQKIVEKYSASEPAILKEDFYHSLLAAYSLDEVKKQLETAELAHLNIEQTSDRHFIASGFL
ncbi:MAG: class I SAM-dependent methyltransferase [Thermodesulfobacteriota bacterium]|nr:class I SAM-dependent methyltransferase [Thermodesulfobacteriota bacterium]